MLPMLNSAKVVLRNVRIVLILLLVELFAMFVKAIFISSMELACHLVQLELTHHLSQVLALIVELQGVRHVFSTVLFKLSANHVSQDT